MDDAAAELAGIAEGLRQQHESNRGLDVRVLPLVDSVVPWPVRRGIWLAFASVLALLAIVGTNVGGLLTARALRRRREFAIRSALGAARSRLLRQLAAENVSLWCVAAAPGVLLAGVLLQLLAAAGLSELPRADEIALTAPVVALAMMAACWSWSWQEAFRHSSRRDLTREWPSAAAVPVQDGCACRTRWWSRRSPGPWRSWSRRPCWPPASCGPTTKTQAIGRLAWRSSASIARCHRASFSTRRND